MVSDEVKVAEGSIVELQTEVGVLMKQIVQASSTVVRQEDAEGRSQRNNVRLLGFPECAEGSAGEAFMENWIRDVLQPTGLSKVFVVERAHRALVAPSWPGATGGHVTLVSWRMLRLEGRLQTLLVELRYNRMEQWRWCLLVWQGVWMWSWSGELGGLCTSLTITLMIQGACCALACGACVKVRVLLWWKDAARIWFWFGWGLT
ncbi:hypothetical protein NDU88_007335 [Pleurodeles waltl]|uniref:Uncharacterized protein n=1 Tax=Pleurodeles waltl TaxID=8319 RepID=A0AAV7N9W8_PLEWA|nr:hypothetical protein NDU88_007335 [Pleurodeles waltl]